MMHIKPFMAKPFVVRAGRVLSLAVLLGLTGAFIYAALLGEHGMRRQAEITAQTHHLQAELGALQGEVARMQTLTRHLSDESLDLDLLDQQARDLLGLVRADEVILFP